MQDIVMIAADDAGRYGNSMIKAIRLERKHRIILPLAFFHLKLIQILKKTSTAG
jgi:hypothetical protein